MLASPVGSRKVDDVFEHAYDGGSRVHPSDDQLDLLAMCRVKGADWYLLAREAQRVGGMQRLRAGQFTEVGEHTDKAAAALTAAAEDLDQRREAALAEIERAQKVGARLVTVADDAYPTTLRLIVNLPPFLFVQGEMKQDDLLSVAIVGTRQASPTGCASAASLARHLVEHEVTVVSGLARGIDTAAHTAALEAGGRTIAVVGTGITRCYPAENRELAERIAKHGAVVSQFWPSAPPATYTFPRRNVTMSGIAQGTAVIEASSTSGAKMQARMALEHGKKVFLPRDLIEAHDWARSYAQRRGAYIVDNLDEILAHLAPPAAIHADDERRVQLSLL